MRNRWLHPIPFLLAGAVGLLGVWLLPAWPAGGKTPSPPLERTDTVSRHGITWQFAEKVPVGRFVNGDYYVVGPATLVAITPQPEEGRNGSVLNLPLDAGKSGFDDRVAGGRWAPEWRALLPLSLKPGDLLISTISVEKMGELPAPLRPADKALSPVRTASILTCLAEPVPPDAFRPSYGDYGKPQIYLARNLRRDLLPQLPRAGIPLEMENHVPFTIEEWADRFERPWLDVCFFGFDAAIEYQPHYGREVGRAVGVASLLLCLDFPPEEKERLLLNFVQYGIDLWGLVRAGYPGWPAHGGHGSGRKWPIVFAGLLLGDEAMQSPTKTYPNLKFGEDMQTMYDQGWTGATAVYAGHVGREGLPGQPDWGAYEHLPPAQWPGNLGENYRRCCTSLAWVGQALAARLLHAEKAWDHPAFFDYVDRWMTEDDTQHIEEIKKARGWDYSQAWARQRQAWDPFVEAMWAKYRNNLPTANRSQEKPDPLPEGFGLAAKYPGDQGLESDPAVIFAENFETGDLKKWDDLDGNKPPEVRLVTGQEEVHRGHYAVQLEVQPGQGVGADLTKLFLPGYDTVYARWYCRFAPDFDQGNLMHFAGLAGLRDRWQLGRSGEKPDGTDFFISNLEPWRDWGRHPAPGALGFYTYFVDMKPDPSGPYYGNSFRPNDPPVLMERGRWYCLEMMIQANHPDQADGEQAFWVDGQLKGHYTGIRWRTTANLKTNALWLLLYIHDNSQVNRVWYDDVVVGTAYIGPLQG